MEIKTLLKDYTDLANQMEELEAKKSELKNSILEQLNELGTDKYTDNEYSAVIAYKEGFKYNDEQGIINWLKSNGYEKFVIEKVDTKLNKELKAETSVLTESLKGMYTQTTTSALTVKRI